ncbi:cell division ABC transporter subunit FtsX [Hartmannibacter diazotrophicus]|uniref:Cell division ABC transporter subunit FtsX n=1 Tax=Hartmannibacter diazotrophicus TaxID=1482074 RepID=A0A2C9DCL2_9HYPH|nr:ABC transporter permease [Hartmannibacter diazotrophicus]SON57910.1 cell division ABC transporter subunit FtsX [Hartmannibacter diazotrophicus]
MTVGRNDALRDRLGKHARRRRAGADGATPDFWQGASIVPSQSIAGRALTLVIAIMTFLASLTLGAVTVVDDAATAWASDIGRELTIEVRPVDGVDLAGEVAKAVALAQEFPGVGSAHALTDDETKRLLEPWLGSGIDLNALPVPRLVVIQISDPTQIDLSAMGREVARQVRGGSLDDHLAWIDRLRAMAGAMVAGGVGIFILVLTALVFSVVFATRAAMAGNSDVIGVLHFVGAEAGFIAREFQRHFLLLGIKGAAIGGGAAILVFALADWATRSAAGIPEADQVTSFLGGISVSPVGYALVLVLVFAVAILTAATSRFAVHRALHAIE